MDRWAELAGDYERAVREGQPHRALQSLGEFALTAPASKVREHYRLLADASADLGQGRTREHLERLLKLLRQRAGITESPPRLVSFKSQSVRAGAAKR
jgi:hypothetical protein